MSNRFMVASRFEQTSTEPDEQHEVFFASTGTQQVGDDTTSYAEAARIVKALNDAPPEAQDQYIVRLAPYDQQAFQAGLQAAVATLAELPTAADPEATRARLAAIVQPMVETEQRALRTILAAAEVVALLGWEDAPWATLDLSGRGDPARAAAGHLVQLLVRSGQRIGWSSPIPPGTTTYAASILQRDHTGEFTMSVLVHLFVMAGAVQAHRAQLHAAAVRTDELS